MTLLLLVLIGLPLVYWSGIFMWWLFRMVFWSVLILIALAGHAWRGELRI